MLLSLSHDYLSRAGFHRGENVNLFLGKYLDFFVKGWGVGGGEASKLDTAKNNNREIREYIKERLI